MNLELLISDWSGVISRDIDTVVWAKNEVRKLYGAKPLTKKEFCDGYANFEVDLVEDKELLWKQYKEFFKKAPIHPTTIPGSVQAIKSFHDKGVKVVVFSSHPQEFLDQEAKEYCVDQYIDLLQGSVNLDKSKVIEGFVDQFKFPKENIIYVGDTTVDIEAAKKAGVTAVAVTSGYHGEEIYGGYYKLEEAVPDLVVSDLADVFMIYQFML